MSEPFIGEIRMFAGSFAPRGWAFCEGQLLAVSQNDALFSLLGTIYGGDGRTTYGLPDLRGRIPIHAGSGPGLTPRKLGAHSGTENETLTVNQLPEHTHQFSAVTEAGTDTSPANATMAPVAAGNLYRTPFDGLPFVGLDPSSAAATGGGQSHTNLMPALCIHFIIALVGIYPSKH